jgi:hypothetical protein
MSTVPLDGRAPQPDGAPNWTRYNFWRDGLLYEPDFAANQHAAIESNPDLKDLLRAISEHLGARWPDAFEFEPYLIDAKFDNEVGVHQPILFIIYRRRVPVGVADGVTEYDIIGEETMHLVTRVPVQDGGRIREGIRLTPPQGTSDHEMTIADPAQVASFEVLMQAFERDIVQRDARAFN